MLSDQVGKLEKERDFMASQADVRGQRIRELNDEVDELKAQLASRPLATTPEVIEAIKGATIATLKKYDYGNSEDYKSRVYGFDCRRAIRDYQKEIKSRLEAIPAHPPAAPKVAPGIDALIDEVENYLDENQSRPPVGCNDFSSGWVDATGEMAKELKRLIAEQGGEMPSFEEKARVWRQKWKEANAAQPDARALLQRFKECGRVHGVLWSGNMDIIADKFLASNDLADFQPEPTQLFSLEQIEDAALRAYSKRRMFNNPQTNTQYSTEQDFRLKLITELKALKPQPPAPTYGMSKEWVVDRIKRDYATIQRGKGSKYRIGAADLANRLSKSINAADIPAQPENKTPEKRCPECEAHTFIAKHNPASDHPELMTQREECTICDWFGDESPIKADEKGEDDAE